MELTAIHLYIFLGVLSLVYLGYDILLLFRKQPVVDFGYISSAVSNPDFLISWTAPNVNSDDSTVIWTQAPILKYSIQNAIGYTIPDKTTDILLDDIYKAITIKRAVVLNRNSSNINFSLATRGNDSSLLNIQSLLTGIPYSETPTYKTFDPPLSYQLDTKSSPEAIQGGITILLNNDGSSTPGKFYCYGTYICIVCEIAS